MHALFFFFDDVDFCVVVAIDGNTETCMLTMATHHNFDFNFDLILEDGPSTERSLSDDHDDVVPLDWTSQGYRGPSRVRKSRCFHLLAMLCISLLTLALTAHIATNQ